MKQPSKKDIMKKWSNILGSMGMTGSKADWMSQYANAHIDNETQQNNIGKMGNKYISPGVYIRDVDSSIYTPPKNYRRIKKILRIFLKK
jgi:hypothetical protein